MLQHTSPPALDEILSTTVRFVIFSFTIFNLIIYRIMLFYFSLLWRNKPGQVLSVATCRFTGFLRTVHYVLWQLWQLIVTRFVITFIGWMFLNILFRFQDSTHPEQLCLPLTVLRMMWWPLRPWPGGLCLYWLLQEWTPMSGSLTQLGLPQLSTIGDISLSYRFIGLVTIQWSLP